MVPSVQVRGRQVTIFASSNCTLMALRTLTRGRIACTNSVSELDILDSMTDEWDHEDERFSCAALDLHLHCEYAAKDASAIHDILMGFITNGNYTDWLCQELQLRQENAVAAVKKTVATISELGLERPGKVPAVTEIVKRAEHVLSQLESLQGVFMQLQEDIQTAMGEAARKQREAETQKQIDEQLEKSA